MMGETDRTAQVSIEMSDLNRMLASSISEKLRDNSPSLLVSSIFRVPQKLRRRNENVYDPNIVSIGPYHRGTKRLAPMEKIKMWYLGSLLKRFPLPPDEALEHIVESIRELQRRARDCYANPFKLNEEKFIGILVVDGCFLLELFRKDAYIAPRHRDDPIFNTSWMFENLYHDLILMENQIPWFVLHRLYELTASTSEQEPDFLVKLVLKFFETMMLMTVPAEYRSNGREVKHILDLLHSCLLSSSGGRIPQNKNLELFPPVMDLLQAGVKFKKGTPDDILNIKFSKGSFEIPPIKIRGNSESLFRNLIAYEQCDRHCMDQFTSYAVFLDCLINTSKDADLLCDEDIVVHALSTEDISLLFNRLYNDTLISEFYYGGIARNINEYYRSRWPRWRATLMRDYFRNPWSISSFIAAIFILIFTFTQTLFTILSY
ncbi:hypothetical protein F2P56_029830 [Juglans regia]|uniref:Uncharacterized protein n=2 Tax=Juglans regia TaxID=51240 RepID=A0A833WX32_JUGRE|nr:UPF0481 protein At3g47200-like [Juglans regia]KAF5449379.1 hypothetical protein F2P56_029830 [Juglans regia]